MALRIAALIALACAGAVTAFLLLHDATPAGSHTTMLPSPTTATAPR